MSKKIFFQRDSFIYEIYKKEIKYIASALF